VYLLRLDPHFPWRPAAVEAAKRAAFDGFRLGVADLSRAGDLREDAKPGFIVDEASAAQMLHEAANQGYTSVCTVGAIGDAGFENEEGDEFIVHAAAGAATYWRVVVRFNPGDGGELTTRQVARLRRLSDALIARGGPRLICDLIVPPTQWQLSRGIRAFDRELLPQLTTSAIAWLVAVGITPDVWVTEGFERQDDYMQVLASAMRAPNTVGCLVRAAGHSDARTFDLMSVGLSTPGVTGIVLGPAPFWEPVTSWMHGRTTRARAVAAVAEQFRSWVTRLEASRTCVHQEAQCFPADGAAVAGPINTSPFRLFGRH
jgi:myo-inositol catabolism protein IolC